MSPIERAMAIINRILEVKFEDWRYEIEGPMSIAWTQQSGWAADLWYRSPHTGNLASDHENFLKQHQSSLCAYKIDLWVNGEGLVLSTTLEEDVSVVRLKRGKWERLFFGLPSPNSKEPSSYFGVLTQY